MFADFRPLRKHSEPHCQRSSFAYTTKPNLKQSSTAENWLGGPEKNTESLIESVPPFRGMHKLAGPQPESNENSHIFTISRPVTVVPAAAILLTLGDLHGLATSWTILELVRGVNGSSRFSDHVLHVPRGLMISVRPGDHSNFDCANLFHGLLRANIIFSNKEHNALNKPECMI